MNRTRPQRRSRSLTVAAVAVVAAPLAARADVDSALVKQGVAAYAALDYARAIALLEQARSESLTREEKILTYRTLGMAYVAVGQPGPAKIDFQHLLRVDPSAELDRSVAPKVRAVFEEAKARRGHLGARAGAGAADGGADHRAGRAARRTPRHRARRLPGRRRAQDDGVLPQAGRRAVLARASSTPRRRALRRDRAGHGGASAVARVSRRAPRRRRRLRRRRAAASASRSRSRSRARTKPVYKRGWFWGVVGGVAAAGAIATGLALGLPRSNSAPVTVNPQ